LRVLGKNVFSVVNGAVGLLLFDSESVIITNPTVQNQWKLEKICSKDKYLLGATVNKC